MVARLEQRGGDDEKGGGGAAGDQNIAGAKPLPAELRPDRSGMLLYYSNSFREMNGVSDRPGAWKSPKVRALIRAIAATGRTIIFRDGKDHYGVVNGEPRQLELSKPDEKGARTFIRFL